MSTKSQLCCLLLAGCLGAGCGGGTPSGAFTATFPDNRARHVEAVVARVAGASVDDSDPVAVGITTDSVLFALDVATGSVRWQQPSHEGALPHIAGRVVVTREPGGIIGRAMADGSRRFAFADESLELVGADGEGDAVVIVLSTGGGVQARSRIVAFDGGTERWRLDLEQAVGVPAVAGGLAFIPWATQNVSVLELSTGDEVARIRVTDSVVGHAFRLGADVYFGQSGVFRLTPSVASGSSAQSAFYQPELPDLPGRPAFLYDAYRPPPPPSSAAHRIRVDFRPGGEGEHVELSDDNLYVTFYRFVYALSAQDGAVRWVYQSRDDVVGAAAQPGGLLVADAAGRLAFVGATDGTPRWSTETNVRPEVVRFRAGGFTQSGAPTREILPLRDQLLSAAQNTDTRLVPARVLAVQQLARMQDDGATGNLIALCEDRRAPPPVHQAACNALSSRQTGPQAIVAALDRHTRFLEGTTAPPIGPLAQAAVRMGARQVAPLLVSHLHDPQTRGSDLPMIVSALRDLGDATAAEPLRDFLLLYHADRADESLVAALGEAADALVRLEGPVAAEVLQAVVDDPFTIAEVRARCQGALGALAAQHAQDGQDGQDGQDAQDGQDGQDAAQGQTQGAAAQAPEQLTAAHVTVALEPVAVGLRQCLLDAPDHPQSARAIIVVDGAGAVQMVSVTPRDLSGCMGPLIRAQRFPANRHGVRQQLTHTIRR